MIRLQSPEDINALRPMLQQGIISNDDLNQMEIGGGYVATQPQSQQVGPNVSRKMRVIGYGNGQATDLGEEDMRATPIDYTRAGIDIPGIGKGHYSRDGRYAYVPGPEGMTKVVLGYDAAASDRRNDMQLKREFARSQLEQNQLQNEGLAQRNQMLAAGPGFSGPVGPPSQKALEAQFGKPDAGMRWKADGSGMEPLPGGAVEQQTQVAGEKAADAITQIDDLLKHKGFQSAVGVSIPKALGAGFIPGTDTTNFGKRLEQLKGGAFLEAFQTLKGGGQITEVEGKKATAAITRMDTAQSEDEFVAAANEFRGVLERGLDKAKGKGAKVESFGSALPMPTSKSALVPGQSYRTPRGVATWDGQQFVN